MARTPAYQIGSSVFRVGYGDLLKSTADVLVSSDDNYLTMGGGVSKAILGKAGGELSSHAKKLLPLTQGDVGVTTAGRLPAKYIFHAITIDIDRSLWPDGKCIETLVNRSLDLAECLQVRTIAFPALGTGTGRYPVFEGAERLVNTICDRLAGNVALEEVSLVLLRGQGVREDDLSVFYQRAATMASMEGQSRKLAEAVDLLQMSVRDDSGEDLRRDLRQLLQDIKEVAAALPRHPRSLEEIDHHQAAARIEGTGRRAIELTDDWPEGSRWRDRQVEKKALQTRLEGLSTLLNVHYGSLNKLEIEKARYAGVGVPLILENQIEEISADIKRVEELMQSTHRKMAESNG